MSILSNVNLVKSIVMKLLSIINSAMALPIPAAWIHPENIKFSDYIKYRLSLKLILNNI